MADHGLRHPASWSLLDPARLYAVCLAAGYAPVDETDDPGDAVAAPGPLLCRIGAWIAERLDEARS